MTISSGQILTASLLNNYLTPVVDTSPGSVQTDFSVYVEKAVTTLDGKCVTLYLALDLTGSDLTHNSGNLSPDKLMYVVDSEYRPDEDVSVGCGTGLVTCEAALYASSGNLYLRSAGGRDVVSGSRIRMTITYNKAG